MFKKYLDKIVISAIVLIISTLVSSIIGCTTSPRQYDPVEYSYSVNTTVDSTRAVHRCGNVDKTDLWKYIQNVNTNSLVLFEYTANKSESTVLNTSVIQLRNIVNELLIRGKFSDTYCTLKVTDIQISSRIISRVLGNSELFSVCEGGIKDRYLKYKDAFDNGKINKSEFDELTGDLLKLEKIDTGSCTMENKRKRQEELEFIKNIVLNNPIENVFH